MRDMLHSERELNYNPPTRGDGSPIWTATIAWPDENFELEEMTRAIERRFEDSHFEWPMRPQVVEALTGFATAETDRS
jgi:hypothetical protein